jgi:SIR2-like domain
MVPNPPRSLIEHLNAGRCVLFAGSGLSAWAGLPTWGNFLKLMVEELHSEEPGRHDGNELGNLIEKGKLLEVADYCKDALNQGHYNNILRSRLRGDNIIDFPEPYHLIVQLPFSAVITTNYDKLLERAYERLKNISPKIPTHMDIESLGTLLFLNEFFILKAHGDIDRPESMILTTRDYRMIIHSNPAFNALFSAILLTKAILFIGYSMNDPDFRLLLDRQLTTFKENVPERYALMSGVGYIEREVLRRSAGIKILPYDEHEDIQAFLEALRDNFVRRSKFYGEGYR